MLTEQLKLPVLWPLTSFGTFSSGGVSVGGIKLEIIETNTVTPWSTAPDDRQRDRGCVRLRLPPARAPRHRETTAGAGRLRCGRLGVLDAVELVIGTRDAGAARGRWQRLLDPLEPAQPLTWRPAVGPAITLVDGDDERVDHLVLAVRSVEAAEQVWREVAEETLSRFPLRFVAGSG